MRDDSAASRVFALKSEVREASRVARQAGLTVGLVPTMGYLHEGHLSLAARAREESDLVIMSIFVNPAQFGPGEDLERYPRDLDRDLGLASEAGVDIVFHPSAAEMYRAGHATWIDVEGLSEHLCGRSRPGHFRGVATVVAKLFSICLPHRAYFGQKDAQQALVIRKMALDLDLDVEVVVCPTVREADGLAMSSRNVYLSPYERAQAPVLYRALERAEALVGAGEREVAAVERAVLAELATSPRARLDYLEIVDTASLKPLGRLQGQVLIALAVYFGGTRLIDNVIVEA